MAKTNIEDIDRNIYDIKNKDNYEFKMQKGLNKEIVEEISKKKNEPEWMRDIRLKALETYNQLELPTWGPDLSELKMDEIATYVKPKTNLNSNWEDVPEDIRNTFDKLGIPEAEKKSLAGVGAQYDSEVVYHSIKEDLKKQGVIYTDMETAVREYPDLVKEHFMKCVPINDHKFVALHAAVWSGGSFVYVPKNVKLDIPLQSYFRLNSPESGQFEHTLIIVDEGASLHFIEGCSAPKYNKVNLHAGCVELYVKDNAYLRYSTIENWSKNMMNLNTKKAIVGKNAEIDWVTGSFGSKISMLYPMSILNGEGAKTEYTGITFAGKGQNLDTGFKVVHNAKNTSSVVNSKSISKDGGSCTYRALVKIGKEAGKSKCTVSCESLMLDNISRSDTIPVNDIRTDDIELKDEESISITNVKFSEKPAMLIVEDNLEMQDFISKRLMDKYDVYRAADGLEALKVLKEFDIDIVVSDIMMPNMDGMELLKNIKETVEYSHIPVILLSAKSDLESRINGLELGADAYIEKPFSLEYLMAQIQNLLMNRKSIKELFYKRPFIEANVVALTKTDELFLKKMNEIIEKNIDNTQFSVDVLTEKMNMSRSSLHRKIKGVTDLTPNDYIRLQRLKRAASLLCESGYRVNEIASLTGFTSASYFTKCFHQHFGMLPKEFIKQSGSSNNLTE